MERQRRGPAVEALGDLDVVNGREPRAKDLVAFDEACEVAVEFAEIDRSTQSAA